MFFCAQGADKGFMKAARDVSAEDAISIIVLLEVAAAVVFTLLRLIW